MITEYGKNCIEIDNETLIPRWSIVQVYPDTFKEKEYWVCYDQDQINITPEEREKLKAWLNEFKQDYPIKDIYKE